MMMKVEEYKIVVDGGKPYEIKVDSKEGLLRELVKLEEEAKKDYPCFDVYVYRDDVDITDEAFEEYGRYIEE